ncbi:hypothetical protein [Clostridium formicaceticum]|uniref:Uncharacterized protein n=1 Tax=Clostridium formicaceticum TaxID=1497 RepID=A0AAC9RP79_9CLOT|nr:hypothetical protein [Clostridium formicaceticum]AOY74712.1 hypothetical protein BJL90_01325 [Clostridium formicaceticum]ARE89092.1 hypothetical protein CLFO_34980 [Clostridium formicaceticum]
MKEIFTLADSLKELKEWKKQLDQERKEVNGKIEALEESLSQAMIQEELENFNRGGMMYYLNTKLYANAIPQRKEALFTALKKEGYGDLVYETVNANSLAAFIKEQVEENDEKLPSWLEGLVNTYEKISVGMRKGK